MGAPGSKWNSLFENYLNFLAAHRGTVMHINDAVQVDSEKKEFTYFIPGGKEPHADFLKRATRLQLTPWAHRPARGYPGFVEKGAIVFMHHAPAPSSVGATPGGGAPPTAEAAAGGLEFRLVQDKGEMFAFSNVQCRAFLENSDAYQDWAPYLHRANENNLGQPNQFFYVAYLAGKAVGALLALDSGNVSGLYALATVPDERRRGVGRALMRKAMADAAGRGATDITLQIARDPVAESFFGKLGFTPEFTTPLMEKNQS